MVTDYPHKLKRDEQTAQGPAVMIYDLSDPSAAGDDIEILDQDIVHLGLKPFSARRVVVNLDKRLFVFHSVSHRARSRTRIHPSMMALLIVGPMSRATIDGRDVDCNVLVAAEPGVDVEIVVDEGYEGIALMIPPDEFIQHLRRRGHEKAFRMPRGIELWHSSASELRELFDIGKRLAEARDQRTDVTQRSC